MQDITLKNENRDDLFNYCTKTSAAQQNGIVRAEQKALDRHYEITRIRMFSFDSPKGIT